jgi:hypothetical protein
MRAIGWAPSKASSEPMTSAAAPSVIPGALPAVTEPPSGWKAGLSFASASREVSDRGPSSVLTTVSPFRPGTVTGTISSSKRPASWAAIAR